MGGIINYYHGEKGIVADRWWQPLGDKLAFNIELADNPHRIWARDYAADVGIDPRVGHGDATVYLRLDDTCGIWVRESDQQGSALSEAINRVKLNRERIIKWWRNVDNMDELERIAQELLDETGEPLRVVMGEPVAEGPATPVTFFLSYSSIDSLLARRVYEDISRDAKADVWFDLAQPHRFACNDEDAIANWLEESVQDCQGFVLLLTKTALESEWVTREINFALSKGVGQNNSHMLVLKAEDVAVPGIIQSAGTIIDCDGLWWSRGISEELFAAIYKRQGRKAWLSRRPGVQVRDGDVLYYGDLVTNAGTVVSFDWNTSPCSDSDFRRNDLSWSLEYRSHSGETVRISGGGEDKPADLEMQHGHRIAFINLHRRWGNDLGTGLSLWMRSDDLTVNPDVVLDRYFESLGVNYEYTPTEGQMRKTGVDAFGRVTAIYYLKGRDGQWRRLDAIAWAMLRRDMNMHQVLERFNDVEYEWS
jgi:hypothetical protein